MISGLLHDFDFGYYITHIGFSKKIVLIYYNFKMNRLQSITFLFISSIKHRLPFRLIFLIADYTF